MKIGSYRRAAQPFSKILVTNYENVHQTSVPIQSSKPSFGKKEDGAVEITFKRSSTTSSAPPKLFLAQIMMLEPISYESVPIELFDSEGSPVYSFGKDFHIFWDVCSCPKCCVDDNDEK